MKKEYLIYWYIVCFSLATIIQCIGNKELPQIENVGIIAGIFLALALYLDYTEINKNRR